MSEKGKPAHSIDYLGYFGVVVSVIGTIVTVIFSIKNNADWRDYALIASGWAAAVMFSLFMWRANLISERNHKEIGSLNVQLEVLNERIKNLENELTRSNAVSFYLATLEKTPSATPRAVTQGNHEW